MDNFAHTLFGLSMAKAGLERATPLATTTLVISSNFPDIDVLSRAFGTITYLEHHRGITHSFVGLAALATALTLLLVGFDKMFRLRRDPFLRPIRAMRIFWLAYLGGLSHLFMDFTNSYGVRPLLPFSNRWFYGDVAFVADPWIWLILGASVVWLTARGAARVIFWLAIGTGLSLLAAFAFREPSGGQPIIPVAARAALLIGIAITAIGATLKWGREGEKLARYSLLLFAIYYGSMWLAHESALKQARSSLLVESVSRIVAWPMPTNPMLWQSAANANNLVYTRYVDLTFSGGEWREVGALDKKFVEAIRKSEEGRKFLDFVRYGAAMVEENETGYTISLQDLRFPLRMTVTLDSDLAVRSVYAQWY